MIIKNYFYLKHKQYLNHIKDLEYLVHKILLHIVDVNNYQKHLEIDL